MNVGLVIDIDGVLTHNKQAVAGSPKALSLLASHGIPFVLLTNNTFSS
jgi:HAD superfamily hydrolase (TIGR01456 family)